MVASSSEIFRPLSLTPSAICVGVNLGLKYRTLTAERVLRGPILMWSAGYTSSHSSLSITEMILVSNFFHFN